MLLVCEENRLDSRSTAEMTLEEMTRLKVTLGSSVTIKLYERENRPKRGGIVFGFMPLLLLYILMECRKTTYRGVVRNLSDPDCECLGLPKDKSGRYRRPSAATLNNFANHVLAPVAEEIGNEISAVIPDLLEDPVVTIDSTPLHASRYNYDAEYNPHYEIRMDKAHIIMADGYPLAMALSRGCANDGPFGIPLTETMCGISPDIRLTEFHTDGQYDNFLMYAYIYEHTGAVMRCNQGTDAVYSGFTAEKVAEEYNALWEQDGYDPYKRKDIGFMLRFLCCNGKEESVGMYIRDRSMDKDAAEGKTKARHVCETIHRGVKRWMAFDIFRITKRTKAVRMKCRFLCLQLLATLFKGYLGT